LSNLDPKSKLYLEMFNKLPTLYKMEPQAVRDLLTQDPPEGIELAPLAKIENRMIPVSQDTEIMIRIYTPNGEGPFPIFIYHHGGGWVIGNLDTSDATCRMIANRTKRIVISVDYRLAPEFKFPIPVEDSYAALNWVSVNSNIINGNASNIVVGGDSAGGNLAAVVSLLARDQNGPDIKAQILIYPVTEFSYSSNSYYEFQKGYGLDREWMIWFGNYYLNSDDEKRNKYVSPLLADDLSNLPPAFVINAEFDVLRDEGIAYANRMKAAGVKVETLCEPGLVHTYFTNMELFPERIKATISKIVEFLDNIDQNVPN